MEKIKVAIIGTGNIGTDLLVKILREDCMELIAFVGRRKESPGIQFALEMGVPVYWSGIKFFTTNPGACDVVYDCTDADSARAHAKIFKDQGIRVIDLTPAKVGEMCVPSINANAICKNDNVNMITCGGQATLPLINLVSENCDELKYVELVSQIASKSAGMATRINIDSYIHTTEEAIKKFTNCLDCKIILNLNPAEPCVDMQTTIFIKAENINFDNMLAAIKDKIISIKEYVPNYELILPPVINDQNILVFSVRVQGLGDYLPKYAGNLDIINCASIEVTKKLWESKKIMGEQNYDDHPK